MGDTMTSLIMPDPERNTERILGGPYFVEMIEQTPGIFKHSKSGKCYSVREIGLAWRETRNDVPINGENENG